MAGHAQADAPGGARAGRTQTRILEAAARCLGKYGVARLRMEDVAAEADVSRTLVHRYFGDKVSLVEQVREFVVDEWTATVDRAVAEASDAGEAIATWFAVSLAYVERQPLLPVIFSEDALAATGGADQGTLKSQERMRSRLSEFLERGVREGLFPADLDQPACAEALLQIHVGLMSGLVRRRPASRVSAERWTSAAVRILVSGLSR